MLEAHYGNLDCLEHLIAKGASLEATNNVSAAPPAAPSPLRPLAHRPLASTRRPCCPALPAAAHGVWRRRRASAVRLAAIYGKFGCLEHLIANGANLETTDGVSAAPPAVPSPLRPSPSALAARRAPAAPPSPPPLTARDAAAAPPQDGNTALMNAAKNGKLDCLEHLTSPRAPT